jgi:hypothetical protein
MTRTMPEIHVVLAVFKPDMSALERQIGSVLAQQGCAVHVHLFADGPMPQLPQIEALAGRHAAMSLTLFPENRGPAATFLEGLAHVLAKAGNAPGPRWFAFCDQDDVWTADKLAASHVRLEQASAACVHADARVTDTSQNVIAPSLFALEQRKHSPSLAALFFRNTATGMTMLFTEALARQVTAHRHLRPARWLHDHFTAFIAACGNGLAYEDRALADYVQHEGNLVGAGGVRSRQPRGGFLGSDSGAAQLLASGDLLVQALLEDRSTPAHKRPEIARLHKLLTERGVSELWRALRAQTNIPRALLARLFWSKLSR